MHLCSVTRMSDMRRFVIESTSPTHTPGVVVDVVVVDPFVVGVASFRPPISIRPLDGVFIAFSVDPI